MQLYGRSNVYICRKRLINKAPIFFFAAEATCLGHLRIMFVQRQLAAWKMRTVLVEYENE